MKIHHHSASPAVQPTDKSVKSGTTSAKVSAAATSTDSVNISDASRALSTGSTSTEAPFDAQRVDAIKSAISSGQFKVNPEAVADKVIASASQLLTGKA
jgi:negative regulator of flagellin synthesis FlgM